MLILRQNIMIHGLREEGFLDEAEEFSVKMNRMVSCVIVSPTTRSLRGFLINRCFYEALA